MFGGPPMPMMGGASTIHQQPSNMTMAPNVSGCAQQSSSTNVIVNTAGGTQGQQRPWFASLFGCFDNLSVCCCGLLCPCIYLCMVYQTYGEGCGPPCCICPPCYALMALRIHARDLEDIAGSICNDCMMSCICCQCVLCQLRREWDAVIRFRGHRIGYTTPNVW